MKTISLIGMPGSGKTTLGMILARTLSMEFVDLDRCIEDRHGDILSLFRQGEDVFREKEMETLKSCLEMQGVILSTGGGIVEREENVALLREHTLVVFLDRPLHLIRNDIDFATRPLLREDPVALERLHARRYPKYKAACHLHVCNSGTLEETLTTITCMLEKSTWFP